MRYEFMTLIVDLHAATTTMFCFVFFFQTRKVELHISKEANNKAAAAKPTMRS